MRARKRDRAATDAKLSAYETVAATFEHWRPAGELLMKVEAQPTIFPWFDMQTRCGGWPRRRVGLVHGPSGHGKTAFALGLGLSHLLAGHFFAYVDAEYTTPEEWLKQLMSSHFKTASGARNPLFQSMLPKNYEQVVVGVREIVTKVYDATTAGELPAGTSVFIVIDSLRKLVPKNLLDKLLKGKGGLDGADGRAQMMKAALNAQWLDELTPLLYHTNASLLIIARESENPQAAAKGGGKWAVDYKVGGGKAVLYDSSLGMRVTRAGWVRDGSGEEAPVVGEKHRVRIHKSKVGGREDRVADAFFHTSNGAVVPAGFDRARDVFVMAVDSGLVDSKGSWFSYEGERLGQGASKSVRALHDDQQLLNKVEGELRKHFVRSAA